MEDRHFAMMPYAHLNASPYRSAAAARAAANDSRSLPLMARAWRVHDTWVFTRPKNRAGVSKGARQRTAFSFSASMKSSLTKASASSAVMVWVAVALPLPWEEGAAATVAAAAGRRNLSWATMASLTALDTAGSYSQS